LILKIEEVIRSREVEGILVTHGTDTMSYTASAVSIAFGRSLPIPVIFTGSQLPLVSFGTDARFNLENSIKVVIEAANKEIAEVMIVFGDKILRGNRSIKVSEAKFLAFDTPAIEPLGWIDALGIHFNPNISLRTSGVGLTVKPDFSSDILSVDVSPGLQPSLLKNLILSGLCKGILFKSLGAGNVPSEGDFSLMPVIELAIKNNIPVLITTKFVGGHTHMDIYEPGSLALRKGAISCGDMTDVMSQVKFMWILGQGYSSIGDIEKAVIKNFAGEISSA
jgi:L-asparaginase